jgi:hypothetical protein
LRALHFGSAEVDAAPHTRESITSLSAWEELMKLLVVPELGLVALNAILSVPKKACSAPTIAAPPVGYPAAPSGNPGVSKRDIQFGSGVVVGLPSLAASRMR